MVDVTQLVEYLTVTQAVAGSSPVIHPDSVFDLWRSWLARFLDMKKVSSSSLDRSTAGSLAQSVAQHVYTVTVGSSILSRTTRV